MTARPRLCGGGHPVPARRRIEAEARFLRAYFYFFLVRAYGGVPKITAPLEPGEFEQTRASRDSIYALIERDLNAASDALPSRAEYSGDDMGRAFGESFDMTGFHGLDFQDNGVKYCGVKTDDNEGASMVVSYDEGDHPLIDGLAGTSFLYGDDIDRTHPRGEGERVLAWATLADGTCDVVVPTIVALDPNE